MTMTFSMTLAIILTFLFLCRDCVSFYREGMVIVPANNLRI